MHLRSQDARLAEPVVRVGSVGKVVRSLCHAGASGTVVMKFEQCAYLQFNEQLVCFGLNELGASSISGVFDHAVRTLPESLLVGATAQLSTEYLVIDDRYFFELSGATLYLSVLHERPSSIGLSAIQYELLAKLTIPSRGLAPLLRHFINATSIKAVLMGTVDATCVESELLGFAMPAIARLADQIRANCANGIVEPMRNGFDPIFFQQLVGAGPGLTPSGDDFLCGVFTALHIAGFPGIAKLLWASICTATEQSTTRVSAALLEQSALGESGARIDDVIKAYRDYPTTTAEEFQRRVALIGETSGWDWLAGFVMCSDILWRNQGKMLGNIDLN